MNPFTSSEVLVSDRASRIKLHFQDSKGNPIRTVEANEGDDILAVAHEYDIDLEGTQIHLLPAVLLALLILPKVPAKAPSPARPAMLFCPRKSTTSFQNPRTTKTTC